MTVEQQGGDHESDLHKDRIREYNIPKFGRTQPCKDMFDKPSKRVSEAQGGTHLGWRWSKLRKAYMQKNPLCGMCGKCADVVHHIRQRSTHPELTYRWTNLLSMCHSCHDAHHNFGKKEET